jgi:hypothetical protein
MLPPVLPDCANAAPSPTATMDDMQSRTTLIGLRMGRRIITWLPMGRAEI